jgi:hypothetical protein
VPRSPSSIHAPATQTVFPTSGLSGGSASVCSPSEASGSCFDDPICRLTGCAAKPTIWLIFNTTPDEAGQVGEG